MPTGEYRAGFYAENLLLYDPQCQEEGMLPIPIGIDHKFPPVALGVSPLTAHELILFIMQFAI